LAETAVLPKQSDSPKGMRTPVYLDLIRNERVEVLLNPGVALSARF
jgi:hypothetical protein